MVMFPLKNLARKGLNWLYGTRLENRDRKHYRIQILSVWHPRFHKNECHRIIEKFLMADFEQIQVRHYEKVVHWYSPLP